MPDKNPIQRTTVKTSSGTGLRADNQPSRGATLSGTNPAGTDPAGTTERPVDKNLDTDQLTSDDTNLGSANLDNNNPTSFSVSTPVSRLSKTLLGAAILFGLLGFGNIIYGSQKTDHYTTLLSRAKSELASPSKQPDLPIIGPTVDVDTQVRYINRLRTRLNYYSFTLIGGKCFLALAGICLLAALASLRQGEKDAS